MSEPTPQQVICEGLAGCDSKGCGGVGWFVVDWPGKPAHRFCAVCAARARKVGAAIGLDVLPRPVVLRCWRCAHVGSHTAGGRELCAGCGAEHRRA
jgi:hypothetical protein